MGSELARLDERLETARMRALVGPLAGVDPLVSLEGLFAREGALTVAAPDGALRLDALLDQRRDFGPLRAASLLEVFHFSIDYW